MRVVGLVVGVVLPLLLIKSGAFFVLLRLRLRLGVDHKDWHRIVMSEEIDVSKRS